MRNVLALLLCCLLTPFTGCKQAPKSSLAKCGAKPKTPVAVARAAQPMGKGVELYAWKPMDSDWHFSVLPGTNCSKTIAMIADPDHVVVGTGSLKAKLSTLAVGEHVVPIRMSCDAHGLPVWEWSKRGQLPADLVRDLKDHCNKLGIELYVP